MAVKSKKTRPSAQTANPNSTSAVFELGFAIDESESMRSLKDVLIGSVNVMHQELATPETDLTEVFFSSDCRTPTNGQPIAKTRPLNQQTYIPYGNTALLDGIALTINHIGKRFETRQARLGDKLKVLIAIFTDGFENSSKFYRIDDVAQMIAYRQTACSWQFLLITPKSGIAFGRRLQIPEQNIVDFQSNPKSLKEVLARLARAIKAYQLGDSNYSRFLLTE